MLHYMDVDFGNAGSRTHEYGSRARKAVEKARRQVAGVLNAKPEEVVFTSGATEGNNLAILGLAAHGQSTGNMHVVSTQIEHNAVLEPLEELSKRGFEITLVPPTQGGWVEPRAVLEALRPDTLLVSVMHVNNETGVIQPLDEIAELLTGHHAYFHTDASQGFGKDIPPLRNARVDLVSLSGHKIHAPKGVGALIVRRRDSARLPLTPLVFGGGQERGLRPGTQPVHLIAGMGEAAELALNECDGRAEVCKSFKQVLLDQLGVLGPVIHGDAARSLPNAVNLSFPGLDADAVMIALRDVVAISNGSACTSDSVKPSHVLKAMGLVGDELHSALRWSWCHLSEAPDWGRVVQTLKNLL